MNNFPEVLRAEDNERGREYRLDIIASVGGHGIGGLIELLECCDTSTAETRVRLAKIGYHLETARRGLEILAGDRAAGV